MMHRVTRTSAAVLLCSAVLACSETPTSPDIAQSASWSTAPAPGTGSSHPTVIFVVTQGLFFTTCQVTQLLPMHGEFQLLVNGRTNFGPGQPGYLDGRWWEDLNGNSIQDRADRFFLCPLLLPGRPIA